VIWKAVVVSGGIKTEGWVEEGDTQGKNKKTSNLWASIIHAIIFRCVFKQGKSFESNFPLK
jgi:hypothetical protein